MWILGALILIVCALGIYSVRAWLSLLHEERKSRTCPFCGWIAMPDESAPAARALRSCQHCGTRTGMHHMSASGWINSTLRPPE